MHTIVAHRASGIIYRFVKQYPGCYILPANICPVVPLTIIAAGSTVKFVDISRETWCISEHDCKELIKTDNNVVGLIFVHTYGCDCNPQSFFKDIKNIREEVFIVDDRCLCVPSVETPCTIADLTLYSTGYAKYIDLGMGGYGFLQDKLFLSQEFVQYEGSDVESFYKKCFQNKTKVQNRIPYGWLDAEVSYGYDISYFSKIENAKSDVKKKKNRINSIYETNLVPYNKLGKDYNNWRYNILVNEKDGVMSSIFASGLFASSHYQPSSELFCDEVFTNSRWLFEHVINLFNDKYITEEQAIKLTEIINFANLP
jgi:dTDP-4-amino-4,6-dideoxygalactose transaminase